MTDNVQALICSYPTAVTLGEFCNRVATTSTIGYLSSKHTKETITWLQGPFTKTVRRARNANLKKVTDTEGAHTFFYNDDSITVFKPMSYDTMAKAVKKTQLFKEELVIEDYIDENAAFTIIVNRSLLMSSGKTAAQVAHAAMKWHIKNKNKIIQTFNVTFLHEKDFNNKLEESTKPIKIIDNGLTELEGKTLTCFAVTI